MNSVGPLGLGVRDGPKSNDFGYGGGFVRRPSKLEGSAIKLTLANDGTQSAYLELFVLWHWDCDSRCP